MPLLSFSLIDLFEILDCQVINAEGRNRTELYENQLAIHQCFKVLS